jgi:hypothetical protein
MFFIEAEPTAAPQAAPSSLVVKAARMIRADSHTIGSAQSMLTSCPSGGRHEQSFDPHDLSEPSRA